MNFRWWPFSQVRYVPVRVTLSDGEHQKSTVIYYKVRKRRH